MSVNLITQPCCNPLFPPITSQFSAILTAGSESLTSPSDESDPKPDTSITQAQGCNLFPPWLSRPLPDGKADLGPRALKRELRWRSADGGSTAVQDEAGRG